MQGEKDCQVRSKKDFEAWRRALSERTDIEFKLLLISDRTAVMTGKGLQTVVGVSERIRTAFIGVTVRVGGKRLKIDTSVSIGLVRADPAQDTVESGLEKPVRPSIRRKHRAGTGFLQIT